MSLLHDIQAALIEGNEPLNSVLLKLRFLASKLGSSVLEDWVKHEAEGYPDDVEVPDYRVFDVSYTGTFFGPFGAGIQNAPIAPYLVEKFAGKRWTNYQNSQSIAEIEDLLEGAEPDGAFEINCANLTLVLNGKVYPQYSCVQVVGKIARSRLQNVVSTVKARILDLTLRLENEVEHAKEVKIKSPNNTKSRSDSDDVSKITKQVVYGNMTTINNSGDNVQVTFQITQGDITSVAKELNERGIAENDAAEFANLLQSEQPESHIEPFGPKTKTWIGKNISKAIDGTWQIGVSAATSLFTELALRYYGLK